MINITHVGVACGILLTTAVVGRADFVVNGGFETGTFSGWTLSGVSDIKNGSPGSNFVHSGGFGVTLGEGILSQAFLTTPGQVYDLSMWMNEMPAGDAGLLEIRWDNWSVPPGVDYGAVKLLDAFATPDPIVNGWAKYDFHVLALGNISTLEFTLSTQASTYPNNVALDDVSLTEFGGIMPLPPGLVTVPIGTTPPVLPEVGPFLLSRSVTLATPVPEPSTYGLAGALALICAAAWRRRARKVTSTVES